MRIQTWCAAAAAVVFAAPQAYAAQPGGIQGGWDLTVGAAGKTRPSWVKLFERDGKAEAEFIGSGGGKQGIDKVEIERDRAYWQIGDRHYRARLSGDTLTGEVKQADKAPVSFTGERVIRTVDLNGTWNVKVTYGGSTRDRVLELRHAGNSITGTYVAPQFGELAIRNAALKGDQLTFTFDIEPDEGQKMTVHYAWTVHGDRMGGKARVDGSDDQIAATAERERKWGKPIKLFNGKDLNNWDYQPAGRESHWKAVDGVMVNAEHGANIYTKQQFADFKLTLDVKVPEHGNSGIYLRGRYEVQVAADHGKGPSPGGMGAVYARVVPSTNASKPADEWQTFEIRFVNYWLTVVLNGTTIVDNQMIEGITGGAIDSRERLPGPILLQGDHGHIEYRNLVLTPVAKE